VENANQEQQQIAILYVLFCAFQRYFFMSYAKKY